MDTRFTGREMDLIAAAIRAELADLEKKYPDEMNEETTPQWAFNRMREFRRILNKINY